ncbi:MAG: SusC/RagA family TonB-linked outer membrane protein [Bacteroidales bacterium]
MKKLTLLMVFSVFLGIQFIFAQKQITGKVTSSEDGSALPGVTVTAKGATTGTFTDVNGKYTISVPSGAITLMFSFIGMKTQEVEIGNKTVIDVNIEPSSTQLEGMVVTALGIPKEKKSLGYSVQDLKGDELAKAKENNIVNSLSGKVSGVQITNSSGAVGASSRIVIRGTSSLAGNNQPLFVIDGVAMNNTEFGSADGYGGANRGNGVADINPDDVENISVLKGPNAAALYGSQAANGVILITTKAGSLSSKIGKEKTGLGIEVGNSTTFEKPLRLPDFQNSYGQGAEGEFSWVDGNGGGIKDGVDESWGPKLDAGLMIPQYNSPVTGGVREATPWISHPDNIKDFLETGVTTTTNFAITGGTKDANLRLSYTNLNQKGMLPNTNYKKNTLALGGSANVTDKLNISGVANYVMANSDNMPGIGYDGQNVFQQFIWAARQVNYSDLKDYTDPVNGWANPNNLAVTKYNWNYNYHNNPYFTMFENTNTVDRDRIYGNAKVSYQFLENLSAFGRIGTDNYSNLNTSRAAWGDIDNPYGYYNESLTTFKQVTSDFMIMYNRKLNSDFAMDLNFGGSRMNQNIHEIFASADELAVEGVYTIGNSRVSSHPTSSIHDKAINSLYGSGQLSYKNAIYLYLTLRNDWSSTLPAAHNSYYYPSVSLSSVLTELFKFESKTLSFAKVRVSWAQVGSDTDPYSLSPVLSFGDGWNSSTIFMNQFVPNELPNSDLRPQQCNSIELGTELKFFMDRVSLDFTYYNQKTYDQIIRIPISAASGYTTRVINAGEIDQKGIEITLGLVPLKSEKGFNWNILINFAKNQNEVVELAEGVEQYELGTYWDLKIMAIPGQPLGALYGADFLRDPNGNIINVNGVPQKGDLKILGNYQPDWVGGINNEFSYKGVTASFLIDIHKGGDIYSMTNSWGRYAGALEETLIGREGGVIGVGVKDDGYGNYVPNDVVVTAEEYNHAAFTNSIPAGSIFDATYIKLREVRIGYTFKKIPKLGFKEINVSLIGRNLAILYSTIPHVDPETSFNDGNAQGIEFGQLPSAISYGFNISMKF